MHYKTDHIKAYQLFHVPRSLKLSNEILNVTILKVKTFPFGTRTKITLTLNLDYTCNVLFRRVINTVVTYWDHFRILPLRV